MTTTLLSALTERYVHATLRAVPEGRRDDLGAELRSTIGDMVEARVDAGDDPADAERTALTELGDPALLAARYTDQRLQLIGPRFYLTWKRLTVQLLTWVPALVAAVVAAVDVLDGGHTVGQVVVDAGGAAIGTAVQVAFWTTLVFAVLDRVDTGSPPAWTPDLLPDDPVEREPSLADTLGAIAWNLVVAAFLVLQQFRSWVAGPDGDDVPVLDPDLWGSWLPVLLGLVATSIAIELWKYRAGWSVGPVVATVVEAVAFSAIVAWLAAEQRLLNPALAEAVGLGEAGQDRIHLAVAVGAVAVGAWEVVDAVRHGVVRRRRPT